MTASQGLSFQDLIKTLQNFWEEQGCMALMPYDMPMGAGTFHPATVLRALGPDPHKAVFVQPSRRPADSRYGESPNRLGRHHQLQVLLKPAPENIQALYLESLTKIGLNQKKHDIRFFEDNWQSPTMGASGLGWEVQCDGQEITQFTYFQVMGGLTCDPVTVELAIGLERLCMFLQEVDNVYDMRWESSSHDPVRYGDVYRRMEYECSSYYLEHTDTSSLYEQLQKSTEEAHHLSQKGWVWPAYEFSVQASHLFNILDARGFFDHEGRERWIRHIRHAFKACCEALSQQDARPHV